MLTIGFVVAGFGIFGAAAAVAADWVPSISVAGGASCYDYGGDINVAWTIKQVSSAPDGRTYPADIVSLVLTPDETVYQNTNDLNSQLSVSEHIPHGTGATTATVAITVDFTLPSGHQLISAGGSITLPYCPKHQAATATFFMNCDRSANVTINYGGEAQTTATVTGYSLSSATWSSGALPLSQGAVINLVVPSPYTTTITVFQPDGSESQGGAVVARAANLRQSDACAGGAAPTSLPGPTVLPPASVPLPAGNGGGAGAPAPVQPSASAQPAASAGTPEAQASNAGPYAERATTASVAIKPSSQHRSLIAIAVGAMLVGLGISVVVAGAVFGKAITTRK